MNEVIGRKLTAEFTVGYADGTVANLPVEVRAVEVYVGSTLKQTFFGSRGEIATDGPGVYSVQIDPQLYPISTWFRARWVVVHPSEATEGFFDLEYFMREPLPPATDEGTGVLKTISAVATFGEGRHLIGQEIVRRHGILMKRFIGKFVAVFLRKNSGIRCTQCYDLLEKRCVMSDCTLCYGTTFKGGYSDPIFTYIFMKDPLRTLDISELGERKREITNDFWTLPAPVLNPGDMFVRKDGERWVIVSVESNKLEGDEGEHTTRQMGTIRRLDVDDVEMQVPCPDLRRPPETFVGFMKGVTRIDDATGIVFNASGAL